MSGGQHYPLAGRLACRVRTDGHGRAVLAACPRLDVPLILDADGLDALTEQPPPDRLRALLAEAWERKSDVLVPIQMTFFASLRRCLP